MPDDVWQSAVQDYAVAGGPPFLSWASAIDRELITADVGKASMDIQLKPAFDLLELTADIVSAHVSNNSVAIVELSALIGSVHASLAGLGALAEPELLIQEPAVPVRRSVRPDYIVCLEDGRKVKTLKRHLKSRYQMTPKQYRAKWNLPVDYPMVAPSYSEQRRALAHKIGLGRKSVKGSPEPVSAPAKKARALRRKLSLFTAGE